MFSFGVPHHSEYKKKHSLEERRKQSDNILARHVGFVPIIVDCHKEMNLKKHKFLVPYGVNCSHLISAVRSQIKLEGRQALFMFSGNEIVCPTENIKQAYDRYLKNYSDGDKFFYIRVEYENTFG